MNVTLPGSLAPALARGMRFGALSVSLFAAACNRAPEPPPSAPEEAPTQAAAGPADGSAAAPGDGSAAPEAAGAGNSGSGDGSAAQAAPSDDGLTDVQRLAFSRAPLAGRAREIFWGTPEDSEPEVLNATKPENENQHFLFSDELKLHLYYPHIRDLEGAYAGVGSDQAYLFAGWMRAHLVWLTDYDPWISALHRAYAVFFDVSEDAATFRAHWSEDAEPASIELLRARYGEREDWALIERVFRHARGRVARRLRQIDRDMTEAGVPTFLTDADTYNHVRTLVQQGRVRPMLANLLDDEGLLGIAAASRELGVPVRVFYLSNAEDYWRYPDEFKANFLAQFFDERSVILRTNATKPTNGDYRYGVQPGLVFQAWLQQPNVRRVSNVWQRPPVRGPEDFPIHVHDTMPPAAEGSAGEAGAARAAEGAPAAAEAPATP